MGRTGRGIFVLLLALVLTLALSAGAGAALSHTERRVTDEAAHQWYGKISGDKVVWLDQSLGSPGDIYYEDLVTGLEWPITANPSIAEEGLDIDGDLVVWQDYRWGVPNPEIYAYDIPTATEYRLTSDGSNIYQGNPAVSGDTVVWDDDAAGNRDIWAYDFFSGMTDQITSNLSSQERPDISGDIIVWEDWRNTHIDIYYYDLGTGTETRVTTDGANQRYPSIHGNIIAWVDYRHGHEEIYAYDLRTATEWRVTTSNTTKSEPHVDDVYITWSQGNPGWDLYAYDIGWGYVTDVSTHWADQVDASSSGSIFVYADDRNHGLAFYDMYVADADVAWWRAFGSDRYETAVAIAQQHPDFTEQVAIIATGEDFPDALSAAGLAGLYDAPLFLVAKDTVPTSVRTELARRDPAWILIVGGEGAVSKDVFDWLNARYPAVNRIHGSDRYQTAANVAAFMSSVQSGTDFQHVFLARGDAFPDALAVAPVAFAREVPILLTRPDSLPTATANALSTYNVQEAIVLGGTGAVGTGVVGTLDGILGGNGGSPSYRWAGTDRYATAAAIAQQAVSIDWASAGYVGIATGLNFPDALAGGIAAGRQHGVLLLSQKHALPSAASTFLNANQNGIGRLEGYGGSGVLDIAVMNQAAAICDP